MTRVGTQVHPRATGVAPVSSAIRMPRKEKGDPSEIVGMAGVLSQELDLGNGQDMIGLGRA